MRRPLATAALAALAIACAKPQPSPEFQRARERFSEVVKRFPGDAYATPEMDEVLSILDAVPASSADAEAALALRQRILAERREVAEQQARREKLLESAGSPSSSSLAGTASTPDGGPRDGETAAQGAARVERGSALAAGARLADLQAEGECFAPRTDVQVAGGKPGAGAPEQVWALKGSEACKERFPEAVGQFLVFSGGGLTGVAPAESARDVAVERTVEIGRLPDGGPGMVVDGGVVPFPPGSRVEIRDGGAR